MARQWGYKAPWARSRVSSESSNGEPGVNSYTHGLEIRF